MAKKLRRFFSNLLTKWLEDIFILIGVSVVIGTTYLHVNQTAAIYMTGAFFIVLGLILAKK